MSIQDVNQLCMQTSASPILSTALQSQVLKRSTQQMVACSGPSKQRVANGCTMVHAVLSAVLEWANYQPVIAAAVDCLRIMLHYLNAGMAYSHSLSVLFCAALFCIAQAAWQIIQRHAVVICASPLHLLPPDYFLSPVCQHKQIKSNKRDTLTHHHRATRIAGSKGA